MTSVFLRTILTGTVCLASLSSYAQTPHSFDLSGAWNVKEKQHAEGLSCQISAAYQNGFQLRFDVLEGEINTLQINMAQDIFETGQPYNASFATNHGEIGNQTGGAVDAQTLNFDVSLFSDFRKTLITANSLDINVEQNPFAFSLNDFGKILDSTASCQGRKVAMLEQAMPLSEDTPLKQREVYVRRERGTEDTEATQAHVKTTNTVKAVQNIEPASGNDVPEAPVVSANSDTKRMPEPIDLLSEEERAPKSPTKNMAVARVSQRSSDENVSRPSAMAKFMKGEPARISQRVDNASFRSGSSLPVVPSVDVDSKVNAIAEKEAVNAQMDLFEPVEPIQPVLEKTASQGRIVAQVENNQPYEPIVSPAPYEPIVSEVQGYSEVVAAEASVKDVPSAPVDIPVVSATQDAFLSNALAAAKAEQDKAIQEDVAAVAPAAPKPGMRIAVPQPAAAPDAPVAAMGVQETQKQAMMQKMSGSEQAIAAVEPPVQLPWGKPVDVNDVLDASVMAEIPIRVVRSNDVFVSRPVTINDPIIETQEPQMMAKEIAPLPMPDEDVKAVETAALIAAPQPVQLKPAESAVLQAAAPLPPKEMNGRAVVKKVEAKAVDRGFEHKTGPQHSVQLPILPVPQSMQHSKSVKLDAPRPKPVMDSNEEGMFEVSNKPYRLSERARHAEPVINRPKPIIEPRDLELAQTQKTTTIEPVSEDSKKVEEQGKIIKGLQKQLAALQNKVKIIQNKDVESEKDIPVASKSDAKQERAIENVAAMDSSDGENKPVLVTSKRSRPLISRASDLLGATMRAPKPLAQASKDVVEKPIQLMPEQPDVKMMVDTDIATASDKENVEQVIANPAPSVTVLGTEGDAEQKTESVAQKAENILKIAGNAENAEGVKTLNRRDQRPAMNGVSAWSAREGESVKSVLNRWANIANMDLYWSADNQAKVQKDIQLEGDIQAAVQILLAQNKAASHLNGQFIGDKEPVIADKAAKEEGVVVQAAIIPAAGQNVSIMSAQKGASLRRTLEIWSEQENAQLIWKADRDFSVSQAIVQANQYEAAIGKVLEAYENDPVRPVGHLNVDPISQQKLLIIETERVL